MLDPIIDPWESGRRNAKLAHAVKLEKCRKASRELEALAAAFRGRIAAIDDDAEKENAPAV